MAVDQFCLKWNNFQKSIVSAFESLQITEDLADVTLTCEGYNIKAHKIILSACSPYFRSVFKENPCPHPIVILKDVLYIDLLAIINFMYHGEVLVTKDQLKSFLKTAELLQVSGLIGYSDVNVDSLNLPTRNTQKVQKAIKNDDTSGVTKKLKMSPKSRPSRQPISNIPVEIPSVITDAPSEESQGLSESFEMVQVDKIKMETSDEEFCDRIIDNEKTKVQSSILEAALETKDHSPSILERSLMSASATGLQGEMTMLQSTNDIPKAAYLPSKCSQQYDYVIPTVEVTPDVLQPESSKSAELGAEPIQIDPNVQIHAHHSSQCGNCPHCGKVYSNQSALKYHVRLVHSDLTNMYCCHLCPESFDYREGFKKHMAEAHSVRN